MVTKEKNSNKLSYLESIELTSKRYNNTWDYLHDLISYESLLLEIGNKELNLNCETLSAFKKAVNKIAYELKISTKEQFPDLSKFNDILKDLHHEIQSLKRGQRGEECTTTVLKRLHVPHTVIHNCNLKFLSLQAEYDKIVVTTKGIFVIEVKNNKQDMIITEDGFYQP